MCLLANLVEAWEGYDRDQGTYIEIEKGTLVRENLDIEFYDYYEADYVQGYIESFIEYEWHIELRVYDYKQDKYRTFEMSNYNCRKYNRCRNSSEK